MYKRLLFGLCICFLCTATNLFSADPPPVSHVFAELKHSLDSSKAEVGQMIELKVLKSVVVKNQTVIPRDSIIKAHIAKVEKEGKHIRVHVVLDKATIGSTDIPVQGIIAAIAPQPKLDLASDPHYGMMGSNQATRNDPARNTDSESNAAVGVATKLHQEGGSPLSLNEKSQGAIDIDAKIDWDVSSPPPETIVESRGKKFILEAGTQVLIRMAEPKLPN
jgi:hypothetical protein